MSQAIALKPDGIIDRRLRPRAEHGQASRTRTSRASRWWPGTAGPRPGPVAGTPVFFNVTTDPDKVAEVVGDVRHRRLRRQGRRGRVHRQRLRDRDQEVATRWRRRSRNAPSAPCSRPRIRPWPTSPNRMPQLTTSLMQRYGDKWTYSLAINDLYYDFMGAALSAAGKAPGRHRPTTSPAATAASRPISASAPASIQVATVPEPLAHAGLAARRRAQPRLRRRAAIRLLRAGAPGRARTTSPSMAATRTSTIPTTAIATPTGRSGR